MLGDSGRLMAACEGGVCASAPRLAATPARVRDLMKSLRCMAMAPGGLKKGRCASTYFGGRLLSNRGRGQEVRLELCADADWSHCSIWVWSARPGCWKTVRPPERTTKLGM